MSEYPEDEFDIAGRDRAPQGTHRAPRSPWRTLMPYVLVVVLVPLLAWGAVTLIGDRAGDDPDDAAPAPVETTGEPSPEPTTEPEATDTPEPTEEESETPDSDVVLTTTISVLNGSDIAGLAADAAGQLTGAGFTSVGADDYGSAQPDVTTLYYRNAELEATAEEVADILGIDNLVEAASATQNVEIAIVLRSDFG